MVSTATTSMSALNGCTMEPQASARVVGGVASSTALAPCARSRSAAAADDKPVTPKAVC